MPVFHSIEPKDIWIGDHLYIWSSLLHQHHGIVLSVDKTDYDKSEILEFNTYDGSHKKTRAVVQKVSLKDFRRNSILKYVVYGSRYARFKLAGTAYRTQALAPEIVVDHAQHILEQVEFGDGLIVPTDPTSSIITDTPYDLILRNCECLAYWCKTGMWYSEQVEKVVDWIATPLMDLLKAIGDYAVVKRILPGVTQEVVSEVLESSFCIFKDKFCSTLFVQGIGNALAVVIIEFIKHIFRSYQYKNGQMSTKEFISKTIMSIVKGFTIGFFAFAMQALLTAITFGPGALCSWIGIGVGSLIGSFVGNILGRMIVNTVAQILDEPLPLPEEN